jgi:MoxR-like ATPase
VWEAIILEKLTNNQTNYLLFYHSPPGKQSHAGRNIWDDKIGNEYPYGNKSGATSKVIPGSKAVWMYTENDEIYFWGHGEIKSNNKIDDKKSMATMNSFERLGIDNKPKKASASLRDKIKSKERGKWNQSNAIMEIDDKIYNEIIYEETVKEKTFEDEPLPIPTPKDVREGIQEISEFLTIPPEKIREILTGLTSGNNIILSGPIGTGKTELARLIPEIFWKSKGGYHANMFTATADWNTQDVIGGIVPKMNGDNVTYKIQDGCVTESVRKNWDGAQRTYSPGKKESFRGVWTIIDEFNRADIDKAFGQLFTALRTKDLKAPTDRLENYEKIRIPQDYRIIGTLNTADKHYLFQLSDALKSRFLVIEIGLPGLDKKDEEVYYAIKNALRNFSIEPNSIVSFRNGKVIKKDQKFYDLLYQAYNFLSFVRLFKKLGTAILKTVYQNLVAGYKMKYNLKEVLDNSINSVIIPQLEGLPEIELSLINNLQKNNLDEFFKKLNKSRNKRTVSKEVLAKTLNFLKIPEKDFEDFENSEIKDKKVWDKLKINESKQKSEDKMVTNLKQVERSLELLIEQSII